MGAQAEQIIRSYEAAGEAPPPELTVDRPELDPGLSFYLGAFYRLSSCRTWIGGMAGAVPGDIPWTAIAAYADAHGVVGDQRRDLFHHVRLLDHEYQQHHAAEMKRKSKSRG